MKYLIQLLRCKKPKQSAQSTKMAPSETKLRYVKTRNCVLSQKCSYKERMSKIQKPKKLAKPTNIPVVFVFAFM